MDSKSRQILDDFDLAEGQVKKLSANAADAQRALKAAIKHRDKANNRVAKLIRDSGGSAVTLHDNSYIILPGGIVDRIPTHYLQEPWHSLNSDPYPDTFLLRHWLPLNEQFVYVGRSHADIETTVIEKDRAYRFMSIAQAEKYRSQHPRWSRYEIATFGDPSGPPIDAECEESPTAEQIAAAVNGHDAEHAAVAEAFNAAHAALGSDKSDAEIDEAALFNAAEDLVSGLGANLPRFGGGE